MLIYSFITYLLALYYVQTINLLKLLASMVAEISRNPKYLDAPLAQTHANFGAKSCFGKLLP